MHLFTDDEKILSKLSEKGNPLERLDAIMDWNIFLPLLSELFSRKDKVISTPSCLPVFDQSSFSMAFMNRLDDYISVT